MKNVVEKAKQLILVDGATRKRIHRPYYTATCVSKFQMAFQFYTEPLTYVAGQTTPKLKVMAFDPARLQVIESPSKIMCSPH